MKVTSTDMRGNEVLQRFWQLEEVSGDFQGLTHYEQRAVNCFKDTTYRDAEGRYYVQLPKREPHLDLGESQTAAVKRFMQNRRSLQRKGQWKSFHQGLLEYSHLKHAEPVPLPDAVPSQAQFYLPTHGVATESSTNTKLCIVFDGSASTTSRLSLNDILLPGSSIYPLLTSTLN